MPQNGIPATIATNNGVLVELNTDSATNLKVTNAGDTSLSLSGPLSAATQVTTGPGVLKSATNLISALTTTATTSLTTSQIGAFYDVKLNTAALSALTTAQVASLTTTQLVALSLPNVIDQSYGGGNGIPITNGLIFNPGTSQVVDVLKK